MIAFRLLWLSFLFFCFSIEFTLAVPSNQCASLFLIEPSQGGLASLREVIRERGLTLVLDWSAKDVGLSAEELRYLTGARAIYADTIAEQPNPADTTNKLPNSANTTHRPLKLPGVVIHLGPPALNQIVQGEINPMAFSQSPQNKILEAKKIIQLNPSAYPKTFFLEELGLPRVEEKILSLKIVLERVQFVFSEMAKRFPNGFIIKHAYEFQTGDSKHGPVISSKVTPKKLTQYFITHQPAIRRWARHKGLIWGQEDFVAQFFSAHWDPYFAVVYALLKAPHHLMVQELIPIAEEYRADFIWGEVAHIQPRYDEHYDQVYISPNAPRALQFLNSLLKSSNGDLKLAAGGADIAFSKSGDPIVLELNLGGESTYMDPLYLPVSANKFLSQIMGAQTPLIRDLKQLKYQPKAKQQEFIRWFAKKYLQHLSPREREDALSELEFELQLAK